MIYYSCNVKRETRNLKEYYLSFAFHIKRYTLRITRYAKYMSDNFIRHMVAIIATIICLLAYYSGYVSGQNGWWWTSIAVVIIYGGVYKVIDK
ncbi:MAG: hypothetical protein ABII98_02635 [bacterium]